MSFMNNIYLLPNLFSPKREKLLLYELLASLNDYTLVCLTYLLTCEVECRSILQCCIGCDVVDACGFGYLLGHQDLWYIFEDLTEETLYGVSFTISKGSEVAYLELVVELNLLVTKIGRASCRERV